MSGIRRCSSLNRRVHPTIQTNQTPLSADRIYRRRQRARTSERPIGNIVDEFGCFYELFHNVTRLPKSAFLLFRAGRARMPRRHDKRKVIRVLDGSLPSDVRWWLCPTVSAQLRYGVINSRTEGQSPSAHQMAKPCTVLAFFSAGGTPAIPVITGLDHQAPGRSRIPAHRRI